MINIKRALSSSSVLRSLTGLRKEQFDALVITFDQELRKRTKAARRNRQYQRAAGGGRHHTLETSAEKLLFILLYLRVYPTMDVAAFVFDVVRGSICSWVHELQPIVEQTLAQQQDLPQRQIRSIDEFIKQFPAVKRVIIDGTERPVKRPTDPQKRKTQYSGKKKRHTIKNTLVTDRKGKRVLLLGATTDGSVHDKKDLAATGFVEHIPGTIPIDVDLGYKGLDNQYEGIRIPHRKPPNRELTLTQKRANTVLAKRRVAIEQKIGHIKRYRCLSDVYRNRREAFEDAIMLTCTGLSNFYHRTRSAAAA